MTMPTCTGAGLITRMDLVAAGTDVSYRSVKTDGAARAASMLAELL
jgi:hypothetical protein